MSVRKSPEEVRQLRISATLLTDCLDTLVSCAQPGRSGKFLDELAESFIRDHGAVPAFKNYGGQAGRPAFPASICFSRNHVLVHGIPTENDVIAEGDIITIDCGLSLNGWFADAARLFSVGETTAEDKNLIAATKEALSTGIAACVVGNKLGDVCNAIQRSIGKSPYHNVYQFCGHAIGAQMHEDPQIPNFGKVGTGIALKPGMVFCLEPMLKKNNVGIGVLPDNWTIVTLDGSRATHVEHMVLVTEGSPEVLTL